MSEFSEIDVTVVAAFVGGSAAAAGIFSSSPSTLGASSSKLGASSSKLGASSSLGVPSSLVSDIGDDSIELLLITVSASFVGSSSLNVFELLPKRVIGSTFALALFRPFSFLNALRSSADGTLEGTSVTLAPLFSPFVGSSSLNAFELLPKRVIGSTFALALFRPFSFLSAARSSADGTLDSALSSSS